MLKATLTYAAKNAEEFKSLVNWMTGDDKDVSVSVTPPTGHGEYVTAYLEAKGEQRFRLSSEEREEFGEDREGAAKARLDALGLIDDGGDVEMPEDDGGDVFGGDD